MIGLTAKKDFLLNLLSVRFLIGFLLCLVIIPFTMIVSVDEFENQMRIYRIDQQNAENELQKIRVYSELRPTIVKKPEVLSIFSKGISQNIGNTTKVTFGEYPLLPSGHTSSRDNPLLNAFFSLDFATVIAIIISLLALIFSYDTFTRERENGNMKLIFTTRAGRISFIFGKLAGLLLTLLPILIFCYLLAYLIVVVSPDVSLSSSDQAGIALLLLTSVIYMLVFILLGMLISALATHSSSSIILCLLSWIGFLFLIPNMATYISQSISRTPLYDNIQASINKSHIDFEKQRWDIMNKNAQEIGVSISWWNHIEGKDGFEMITGGSWEVAKVHQKCNSLSEPLRVKLADKMWMAQKEYLDKLIRQQQVQQYLSWLSPAELFGQATNALCRTDMNSFLKYMESQRDYRKKIILYFTDNNLFESFAYFTPQPESDFPTQQELVDFYAGKGGRTHPENLMSYTNSDINADNLPRFVYEMSTSGETLKESLSRLAALLGISMLLLLSTIAVFMKYDIR